MDLARSMSLVIWSIAICSRIVERPDRVRVIATVAKIPRITIVRINSIMENPEKLVVVICLLILAMVKM